MQPESISTRMMLAFKLYTCQENKTYMHLSRDNKIQVWARMQMLTHSDFMCVQQDVVLQAITKDETCNAVANIIPIGERGDHFDKTGNRRSNEKRLYQ